MNRATNFQRPLQAVNFCSTGMTINCSLRTLLYGVREHTENDAYTCSLNILLRHNGKGGVGVGVGFDDVGGIGGIGGVALWWCGVAVVR